MSVPMGPDLQLVLVFSLALRWISAHNQMQARLHLALCLLRSLVWEHKTHAHMQDNRSSAELS